MRQRFSASLVQEGDYVIAQCLEVDVASQGTTDAEALANLKEALALHFEPPTATETPQLASIEVDIGAA